MKNKYLAFTSIAAVLFLLAACGGLGDIFNGPQASSYPSTSSDVYGTVNSVDSRGQRINVAVSDNNGSRNVWVPYDSRTQVTYQNQSGSVTQLERGDQIDIRMRSNGVADLVTVTQSASASTYPNQYPPNTYPNPYPTSQGTGRIQGTVSNVDTQNQLILISTPYVNGLRNTQNSFTLYYDSRTRVVYQGNSNYTPADLERGDQIDVSTYNSGNGQIVADTITVTRNVRQ